MVFLAVLIFARLSSPLGDVLYDHFTRLQGFEASSDIVIVAVDETALSQLGGWPLKRSVYVDFLKRLSANGAHPKAIAFDLLFLDPSPLDDALAEQLHQQRVILPLEFVPDVNAPLQTRPRLPVAPVAQSARLAHINLAFDADGVIRGFEPQVQDWMHLSLTMHAQGDPQTFAPQSTLGYQRFRMVDPRVGFATVSLAQVIQEPAIAAMLNNKYVLVGVTAPSLGDRYPTLYSGKNNASTPGVAILASILHASLSQNFVSLGSPAWLFLLSTAGMVLMMYGLVRLSPRPAIGLTSAVVLGGLLVSYWALSQYNLWLDPTALVLVALLLHPLWAWRRLEVLVYFLQDKATALNQLKNLNQPSSKTRDSKDVVLRYTRILDQALEWAQSELQFLAAIVNEIPDAIAIFDNRNTLLLSNRRMQSLFDAEHLQFGASLQSVTQQLGLAQAQDGHDSLDSLNTFALSTRLGQLDFYLKTSRIRLSELRGDVALLILVDVTDLKQSQVQRDQALQFLSHDMRTPVASILALTQTQHPEAAPIQRDKIIQHANALLGMTDDFILSISAQASQYQLSTVLLDHLINDAIEQVTDLATKSQIHLHDSSEPCALFVQVNPRLMLRVFVNLLFNAIKFAPPHSSVELKTWAHIDPMTEQPWAIVQISNAISANTSTLENNRTIEGFGLGLNFVETVIKKHHGKIQRDFSDKPHAEVWIHLPAELSA